MTLLVGNEEQVSGAKEVASALGKGFGLEVFLVSGSGWGVLTGSERAADAVRKKIG